MKLSLRQFFTFGMGKNPAQLTDVEKIVLMRKRVADGRLLESLKQHPGWEVLEREIIEQMAMDVETLAQKMAVKSLWKFLRDGDYKLAARVAGMRRALETVDGVIASAAEAGRRLNELGLK